MSLDPELFQSCLAYGDQMHTVGNDGAAVACWTTLLTDIETRDGPLTDPLLRLVAGLQGRIASFEVSRGEPARALGAMTLAISHLERLQDISVDDASIIAAFKCRMASVLVELDRPVLADARLEAADACLARLDCPDLPQRGIILQRNHIACLRADLKLGRGQPHEARCVLLAARQRLGLLLGPDADEVCLTRAIDLANQIARVELVLDHDDLAHLIAAELDALAERRNRKNPRRPAPDIATAIVRVLLGMRAKNVSMVKDAVEACWAGAYLAALAGGQIDWLRCAVLSRIATDAIHQIEGPMSALIRLEMTRHRLLEMLDMGSTDPEARGVDTMIAIDLHRMGLLDLLDRCDEARAARNAARQWVLGLAARGVTVRSTTFARLGL